MPSRLILFTAQTEKYLGHLGTKPTDRFDYNSTSNPYGPYGSKYHPNSINNPYGPYGSKYSLKSANNPYTLDAPRVYDSNGNYVGKVTANKYDPDSIYRSPRFLIPFSRR